MLKWKAATDIQKWFNLFFLHQKSHKAPNSTLTDYEVCPCR